MSDFPKPKERNLFFSKQVTQDSIGEITKSLIEIAEDDTKLKKVYSLSNLSYIPSPVKIYIDSYGGYAYQCLGLLNIMEKLETPIHTIVTGTAMSCGFMIAISGHERYCYSNSTYMYHQISGFSYGPIEGMKEKMVESNRLQKLFEKIVVDKTLITRDQLKEVRERKKDWFFTSKQALDFDIVDTIL